MSDEKVAAPQEPIRKDGEPPSPGYAVDAFFGAHQAQIRRRKDREAKTQKIFGRRNIGQVTPR
jgi:hypothetical protein